MTLNPLDEAGIARAVEDAKVAFSTAASLEELKEARLAHSGDNAPITHANMQIRNLDKADKPTAGKLLGGARKEIQAALAQATERLEAEDQARVLREERVDVTVPTRRDPQGARHPLPVLMEDISDVFVAMGWEVAEGPELEHEWFNFDSLNFGPDHPARQMQDTFYVEAVERVGSEEVERVADTSGLVLRTDALDSTHTPVFHQIEGLAVDKGLTMEHLKGALDHFAKSMFGPEAKTRLRPSFFPFTEPSAEMDLWFPQKKGGAGWIEWGGCGMVNPEVLRNNGIDPAEYTGFAFGMGIERTLMLRNSIDDMRDMVEGDVRFSIQFGTTGRGA